MFQKLKDYTKCAVRNKLVIGSYAGFGLSFLVKYFEHETGTQIPLVDNIIPFVSLGTLGLTKFGTETYNSYRRMREHIEKHGTIDIRFRNKFYFTYCTQTGIKMAADEAGLGDLIRDDTD